MTRGRTLPVVVDTNVLSFYLDNDSRSDFYREAIGERYPIVSFQTVEEMLFGAERAGWGDHRTRRLRRFLDRFEVFHSNRRLVLTSARLRRECEAAGHALDTADAWIAATAVLLDCPLASNDRGFSMVPGLRLIQGVH